MDIGEFRKNFLEQVNVEAESSKDFTEAAFIRIFMDYLADNGIISDFEYTPFLREKHGSKKIKVDGYSYNQYDDSLSLITNDFYGNDANKTLIKTDSLQLFKFVRSFIEDTMNGTLKKEIDMSNPAYDLMSMVRKISQKVRKYKIYLITDKVLSESVNVIKSDSLLDVPVEYHIWDIKRLSNLIEDGGESPTIYFKDYGYDGIPCIKIDSNSGHISFLCSLPGRLLADLYDKLGSTLLEGNIRSFLSTKGAVNKGIRRTIVNEPEKFFMYNNGISATTTDAEFTDSGGFISLEAINNFQIVNGGQTTASISNSRYLDRSSLQNINVSMKLTIVNPMDASKIIPVIAECANTQNKVGASDFFSNREYCIKLESISRRVFAPAKNGGQLDTHWFFERAKGQYLREQMHKTKSEIQKFMLQNPKSQMFSKTDLAKYRYSWEMYPYYVSRGAQTNFQYFAQQMDNLYEKDQNWINDFYFKESVSLGILFKEVEKLVSSQEWYQQAFRAQIVTYSIALFSHQLRGQFVDFTLDFLDIWKHQEISSKIINEFTHITKIINELINDPSRETANVTQWCKRESCWKNILNKYTYNLNDSILDYCVKNQQVKDIKRAAKKDDKLNDKVSAEIQVYNFGADMWKRLNEFFKYTGNLSFDQTQALSIAMQIPNKMPNSFQAKLLLKLLNNSLDEGFKQN